MNGIKEIILKSPQVINKYLSQHHNAISYQFISREAMNELSEKMIKLKQSHEKRNQIKRNYVSEK